MKEKTAFVTGATGCVGHNLVEALIADGWRVIAAHRASSKVSRLRGLPLELKLVDLHDFDSIMTSLPEGVDAVFHVAGSISHWAPDEAEQWKDNVLATRNLARAALRKKAGRFVFTSTGATCPYIDTTREEAQDIEMSYVRTKRLAEIEVMDAVGDGLDAVIMRPIIIIGRYDNNAYSQIFTTMARGERIGIPPGSIDFCAARDVARAHVSAFHNGRKGDAYLLGGPHATWLELFQRIARLLGVREPKYATPLWVIYLASYPMLWFSYISRKPPLLTPELARLLAAGAEDSFVADERAKAERELGYRSASLDEMLRDCYEWMIGEGMLDPNGRSFPATNELAH